jgi:hypothetical protein
MDRWSRSHLTWLAMVSLTHPPTPTHTLTLSHSPQTFFVVCRDLNGALFSPTGVAPEDMPSIPMEPDHGAQYDAGSWEFVDEEASFVGVCRDP